jgi:hypothetical protein
MKLRTPKFGANPVSPFVNASVGLDSASSEPQPEFKISWEDQQQGVSVVVQAGENGHLIADVFCTNFGLLDKAAVSVALVGTSTEQMIRKAIPLNAPQKHGCAGSADLGPLTAAVKELGPQLGLVVFLLL